MKIVVLEHPRIRSEKRFNDIANTPLWSCLIAGYSAAALRQTGHEVHLLDATKTGWNFEQTRQEVLALSPDLLCVNAVYFWENTGKLFDFFTQLKSEGFAGHINLFGFFPTLAYPAILGEFPAVDSVAVGECETTLAELAGELESGHHWKTVPGLAFRNGENIAMSASRIPEPFPDRFLFPVRTSEPDETVSILASRGCYNHCSFCPIPSFYNNGPLWRGRSPENVIQEIREVMENGSRDFYFVDPNFIGPGQKGKARIRELARGIEPLEITFGMETRPDDLDADILERLVSSGLQSILLGIESGSASVLGNLHKSSRLDVSEKAIQLCRDAGIEPEIGFLMFVPDSTLDDIENNLAFLERNSLLDRLDRTANLLSHCQIVLKGTSGFKRFAKEKRLTPTGPLGFEGRVAFQDHRVKWMSEIVVSRCLDILKDMSRPESPVYWKQTGESPAFKSANDELVNGFKQLLKDARNVAPA